MAWNQIVTPDLDPYVYNNGQLLYDWYGMCLATVETAFGSPRLYANAWEAYNDTTARHEDQNFPVGVYFPIWFSGYSDMGHVAICYVNSDGSMGIWTSPYTHVPYFFTGYNNINALASGYGVTYVGWSEDIAGLRVIVWTDDTPPAPVPVPTPDQTPPPADPLPVETPPAPDSVPPAPSVPPSPAPPPAITPDPTPVVVPTPESPNPKTLILAVIAAVAAVVLWFVTWLHSH